MRALSSEHPGGQDSEDVSVTTGRQDLTGSASAESSSPAGLGPSRRSKCLMGAVVLLPPAVLYILTLYPGVGGRINPGDSAKFQFLGKILGVPHDPGYPQYMMLNHLWTRLPTPLELATHVNLLSAVFTLVAGGLVFAALRRLSGSRMAAALATWTLLLSRAVWTISTEAEVYSLHLVYVAGVLWAGVSWRDTGRDSWLVVLMAFTAFGFGNHPLSVALLPAALVVMVGTNHRILWSGRTVVLLVAFTALSLSQYSYLLWRSHTVGTFLDGFPRNATLGDMLDNMLGGRFAGRFLLGGGFEEILQRGQTLSGKLLQLTVPALVLAAVGLVALIRRDRVAGVFVTLLGIAPAVFVVMYQIGDWGGYVAPVWVPVVTLAAVGAATFRNPGTRGAIVAVWLVALVWTTTSTYPRMAVLSNRWDRSALLSIAEPVGIVLTYVRRARGYRERQLTNYYRLGLGAGTQFGLDLMLAQTAFELNSMHLGDRPIYFMPGDAREYVDEYRMDYVAKETDDDPPIRYFVSSALPDRGRLRIEPVQTGGVIVSTGAKTLVTPTQPMHVVVMASRDYRVKGVMPFDWDEGLEEEHPCPKRTGAPSVVPVRPSISRCSQSADTLLERVRPGDWIAIVSHAPLRPRQSAILERMVARAGGRVDAIPSADRSLVLVGQHSVQTGWRRIVDPNRAVEIALESDGTRLEAPQ